MRKKNKKNIVHMSVKAQRGWGLRSLADKSTKNVCIFGRLPLYVFVFYISSNSYSVVHGLNQFPKVMAALIYEPQCNNPVYQHYLYRKVINSTLLYKKIVFVILGIMRVIDKLSSWLLNEKYTFHFYRFFASINHKPQ